MSDTQAISLSNPRPCGGCTLCCKLFILPELEKPAGVWCQHCSPGKGCNIHPARPQSCRGFQCTWTIVGNLDRNWRPDIAGFVLTTNDMQVSVDVDPAKPDAWKRQPYYAQLKAWSRRNRERPLMVIVRQGGSSIMIFPESDIDLGPVAAEDQIESGYELINGRRMPFARVIQPTPVTSH